MSDSIRGVFEPEAVEAMAAAFERAVAELGDSTVNREFVALKIIGAAQAGELDPDRLCAKAVRCARKISSPSIAA